MAFTSEQGWPVRAAHLPGMGMVNLTVDIGVAFQFAALALEHGHGEFLQQRRGALMDVLVAGMEDVLEAGARSAG